MIRWALISIIAVAAMSQSASAKTKVTIFKTGNDLHDACNADLNSPTGLIEFGSCVGYIEGAVDSYLTLRANMNQPSCLASGVTGTQVRDVVTAYLRDNPGQRHETAANIVVKAMASLIVPCS